MSPEEEQSLQPRQMIWQAIAEYEPAGKPLQECAFKRITLTVHALAEDMEVLKAYGHSAKRGQQIKRGASPKRRWIRERF